MDAPFLPEGSLINTAENILATATLSALEKAFAAGKILEGRVLLCDRNLSLILNLGGCRAVIPHEEIAFTQDGAPCRDIAAITRVGKAVCFVITDIREELGMTTLYLSRKEAQRRCLAEYLDTLKTGDVLRARVTHIEPFGAFCDIGCGITSLLSIDCISVSRISRVEDRFYVGEYIYACVRGRDDVLFGSLGRIALSHKELLGTWEENAAYFEIGQTVAGIVRSVEDYGIFIELSPNLAGLAEYKSGVREGQGCAVYIKNILPEKRKIKLVLISCTPLESAVRHLDYFITQGNVADWEY